MGSKTYEFSCISYLFSTVIYSLLDDIIEQMYKKGEGFMKKMKHFMVLAALMSFFTVAVSGCSKTDNTTAEQTETVTETTEEATTEAELSAVEVAKRMGNGINLGNTMEAYGRKTIGISAEVSQYETSWGQPVTTKEMIDGMKAAGFDSIRIPVAWTNMMDFENGDYTINPLLLDRVQEIVDWAIAADMYVIVNDHWDGGWWGMFGSETKETQDRAMELYKSMWTQVSERFKDYSDLLILESANEELGSRLNDRDYAEDSGNLTEDECYTLTNLINQTFVDVVRSTGGKNESRFLLIAGYNTDIDKTIDDRYKMPTDTATDKLLLSVHYYTPWSYCGATAQASFKSEAAYKEMNRLMGKLSKFTDAGIPVVIGEYGALLTADGEYKNNTIEFTQNLLANCDLYGLVPMLWDTNAFFKKDLLKIEYEELAKLYLDNSYAKQSALSEDDIRKNAQDMLATGLAAGRLNDENSDEVILDGSEKAIAWIMYSDGSWVGNNVGDVYNPTSKVDGLIANDVEITEAGTYTISIDATGTASGHLTGLIFSAIGISNGELLFPGYIIELKELKINGEPYTLLGTPFTSTDDKICTRLNLYNSWVTEAPAEARTKDGSKEGLSAQLIDPLGIDEVQTVEVTFEYGPAE